MSRRYSRVLVAVDRSSPARRAFDHALLLSQTHEAELVVVRAVPLDESFSWHAAERQASIDALRQRADEAGVPFEHRVQQGDPANVILLHARALNPDVIVAGTHQRRGLARLRTPSVGARLVSGAAAPVLLIPPGRRAAARRPLRHVAVAVDLTASATQAIDEAQRWAGQQGGRITLLHVVPGFSDGVPPYLYRYGISEFQQEVMRDAAQRLQRLVPDDWKATGTLDVRVLQGETVTEVTGVVNGIGADLLVVGATTRGVVTRALFGTTASQLLAATRVPMLTVPDVPRPRAVEKPAA